MQVNAKILHLGRVLQLGSCREVQVVPYVNDMRSRHCGSRDTSSSLNSGLGKNFRPPVTIPTLEVPEYFSYE